MDIQSYKSLNVNSAKEPDQLVGEIKCNRKEYDVHSDSKTSLSVNAKLDNNGDRQTGFVCERNPTLQQQGSEDCKIVSMVPKCERCDETNDKHKSYKKMTDMNLKIIKEKISSTDELIKVYRKKCQENEKYCKKIEELSEKLKKCYSENGGLRIELEKAKAANEPLKKTAMRFECEKKLTETLVDDLKAKLKTTQRHLEEVQASMSATSQKSSSLHERLKKFEKENTSLEARLEKKEKAIEKMNSQLKDARAAKRTADHKAKAAFKDVERMKKQLANSNVNATLKEDVIYEKDKPKKGKRKQEISWKRHKSKVGGMVPIKRSVVEENYTEKTESEESDSTDSSDSSDSSTSDSEQDDEVAAIFQLNDKKQLSNRSALFNSTHDVLADFAIPSPPLSPIPPSPAPLWRVERQGMTHARNYRVTRNRKLDLGMSEEMRSNEVNMRGQNESDRTEEQGDKTGVHKLEERNEGEHFKEVNEIEDQPSIANDILSINEMTHDCAKGEQESTLNCMNGSRQNHDQEQPMEDLKQLNLTVGYSRGSDNVMSEILGAVSSDGSDSDDDSDDEDYSSYDSSDPKYDFVNRNGNNYNEKDGNSFRNDGTQLKSELTESKGSLLRKNISTEFACNANYNQDSKADFTDSKADFTSDIKSIQLYEEQNVNKSIDDLENGLGGECKWHVSAPNQDSQNVCQQIETIENEEFTDLKCLTDLRSSSANVCKDAKELMIFCVKERDGVDVEMTGNKMIENKMAENEMAGNKMVENEMIENEMIENEMAGNKMVEQDNDLTRQKVAGAKLDVACTAGSGYSLEPHAQLKLSDVQANGNFIETNVVLDKNVYEIDSMIGSLSKDAVADENVMHIEKKDMKCSVNPKDKLKLKQQKYVFENSGGSIENNDPCAIGNPVNCTRLTKENGSSDESLKKSARETTEGSIEICCTDSMGSVVCNEKHRDKVHSLVSRDSEMSIENSNKLATNVEDERSPTFNSSPLGRAHISKEQTNKFLAQSETTDSTQLTAHASKTSFDTQGFEPSIDTIIAEETDSFFPLSPLPPSPRGQRFPDISPLPITPLPGFLSPLTSPPGLASPPALRESKLTPDVDQALIAKPRAILPTDSVRMLDFSSKNNEACSFETMCSPAKNGRKQSDNQIRAISTITNVKADTRETISATVSNENVQKQKIFIQQKLFAPKGQARTLPFTCVPKDALPSCISLGSDTEEVQENVMKINSAFNSKIFLEGCREDLGSVVGMTETKEIGQTQVGGKDEREVEIQSTSDGGLATRNQCDDEINKKFKNSCKKASSDSIGNCKTFAAQPTRCSPRKRKLIEDITVRSLRSGDKMLCQRNDATSKSSIVKKVRSAEKEKVKENQNAIVDHSCKKEVRVLRSSNKRVKETEKRELRQTRGRNCKGSKLNETALKGKGTEVISERKAIIKSKSTAGKSNDASLLKEKMKGKLELEKDPLTEQTNARGTTIKSKDRMEDQLILMSPSENENGMELDKGGYIDDNDEGTRGSNTSLQKCNDRSIVSDSSDDLSEMKEDTLTVNEIICRSKKQSEVAYAQSCIRLLQDSISLKQVIRQFSAVKNISSATSVVSAIISDLKNCQNDHLQSVYQKISLMYEKENDADETRLFHNGVVGKLGGYPEMPNHELLIIQTVEECAKMPHLNAIMKRLLHIVPKAILSEECMSENGLLSLCRLFTAVCIRCNEKESFKDFLFDVACNSTLVDILDKIIITCYFIWPKIFDEAKVVADKTGTIKDRFGQHCVLFSVQVAALWISCKHENKLRRQALLAIFNWQPNGEDVLQYLCDVLLTCLENDVLQTELEKNELKEILGATAKDLMKSFEIVLAHKGWKWCNNYLTGEHLWKIFRKWSQQQGADEVCSKINDATITTAIRLIGKICCVAMKDGYTSFAIIVKMCCGIISRSSQITTIPSPVQLAAAYTLLDISLTEPETSTTQLTKWLHQTKLVIPTDLRSRILAMTQVKHSF